MRKSQNATESLKEVVSLNYIGMKWKVALLTLALAAFILAVISILPMRSVSAQDSGVQVYLTPVYQEIPGEDDPYGELRVMLDAKSDSVVFARVSIVFNPSEVQIASEVDISNSPLRLSVDVRTAEEANKTGRLVIVLASSAGQSPVSGSFEIARFQIQPSSKAGEAELLFDEEDMQIVNSDAIELPITTEGAVVNVTSLNYYFPYVYNTVPSYEINDSIEQAFGPLVPNNPYISTVGRGDEEDYYYFDVNVLAPINISFSDTGTNHPNYDEEIDYPTMTFYDGARNIVRDFSSGGFTFHPLSIGRYYIRINYCCHFNPEKREYGFKIDFNGTPIPLMDAGYIMSKGKPVPDVPYNYIDWDTYNTYQSLSDSLGKYYIPKRHGECYQLSYGEASPPVITLDQDYIRLAHENFCTENTTDFDISSIYLLEPNNSTEPLKLPVTFKWIVRATQPTESYVIHLSHRNNNNKLIRKTYNVGHIGEYTLDELFDGEGLYHWYVSSYNESDGDWQSFIHEVYLTDGAEGQIVAIPIDNQGKKISVPR